MMWFNKKMIQVLVFSGLMTVPWPLFGQCPGSSASCEDIRSSVADATLKMCANWKWGHFDCSGCQDAKNINYGNATMLEGYPSGPDILPCDCVFDFRRILMRMDVTDIPSNASIECAELFVYVTGTQKVPLCDISSAPDNISQISVNRLLKDWTESGATWNSYDGTNNWTAQGAMSGSDAINSTAFSVEAPFSGWVSVDVTLDVQNFVDGTFDNFGWLLANTSGAQSANLIEFASKEYASGNLAPYIRVRWDDTANTPPNADFNFTIQEDSVSFTDQSATPYGSLVSWLWDFDDGNNASQQDPSHVYGNAGAYDVCLTVTNSCGLSDVACQKVCVGIPPVPGFDYTKRGLSVDFSDTSSNAVNWTWDFGDGQTTGMQHPIHTYSNPGTYPVCLTILNACDEQETTCTNIQVCPLPVADFQDSTSGLEVSFTDLSTEATNWLWDYGNGQTAGIQHPSHSYDSAGTYVVCLTVSNDCDEDSTICKNITVCPLPQSNFSINTDSFIANFSDASVNAVSWFWHFGDGRNDTVQHPVHRYDSFGTYQACLVTKNACEEIDSVCEYLTLTCTPPVADFNYTVDGLTVHFDDTSVNAGNWFWDFGDGDTSVTPDPSHAFAAPDTYQVCLTVVNACGDDTTRCKELIACTPPVAAFNDSVSGFTVYLDDQSVYPTSWFWEFGDGLTDSIQDPVHAYSTAGAYDVCLRTTNLCEDKDTTCGQVCVMISPQAQFGHSENELTINFSDSSVNAVTWFWDFGDGDTSVASSPSHTYATADTYVVCLTISNPCNKEHTRCEEIIVCHTPLSDFSYTANGLAVNFSDSAVNPSNWQWDFGDGNTSTAQHAAHTYAEPDTYNVCLTIYNTCNEQDTACKELIICRLPEAKFGVRTNGLAVDFSDSSTNVTEWHWDFGDGDTSMAPNPSHTYTTPDTYTVCLITSNACNETFTSCEEIIVCALPLADFGYIEQGLSVNFSDSSVNPNSWQWDFGDGDTSAAQHPAHTYAETDTYNVCLTTFNTCNDQHTFCSELIPCRLPKAKFSVYTNGLAVNFSDSSNNVTEWQWDFGDGITSADNAPSHTYADSGTYLVCLTTTNRCGVDSTYCQQVVVCAPPEADFVYSAEELKVEFTSPASDSLSRLWDFGNDSSSNIQNPTHLYDTAGIYNVCLWITDSCGTDSVCKDIQVCNKPIPRFSYDINGTAVKFYDSSYHATSRIWRFGDDDTSIIANPEHNYSANGSYIVCLTTINACYIDSVCDTILVSTVPDEPYKQVEVRVAPNPFHDYSNIYVDMPYPFKGELTMSLYDVVGKKVNTIAVKPPVTVLPATALGKGIYFYQLTMDHRVVTTGKLVIY